MKNQNRIAASMGILPMEHQTIEYIGMRPSSEYVRIANMPTTVEDTRKTHESVLRSWNILRKVKELLEQGVPGEVVLELIDLMETNTIEIPKEAPPAD